MKVLLIETAAPDRPGSMRRYADLIELAFSAEPSIQISRVVWAPSATTIQTYPRRLRTLIHHGTIAWRAKRTFRRADADIFHLVDGSHGYVARWMPPIRSVVTVHDVIPYLQTQGRFPVAAPSRSARWIIEASIRALRQARRLISVSEATARDLVAADAQLTGRVEVVSQPVMPSMLPGTGASLPDWNARRTHDRPYLLHLGNNGFYKNRTGVVRIFDRVRSTVECRLILAGPPPDDVIRATIRERHLDDRVEFVIDPDDARIRELYRSARLLLFPSYYEGFGWPPLEAMAWGCPVVCSRSGSLPEVAGDAALTSEVDNEAELAAHCVRILTDQTMAEALVTAGHAQVDRFSLEKFRHKLLAIYQSLV